VVALAAKVPPAKRAEVIGGLERELEVARAERAARASLTAAAGAALRAEREPSSAAVTAAAVTAAAGFAPFTLFCSEHTHQCG
jgi:hypothetical protein